MADKKSDLYAGGIDSLTDRVVLAFSAQRPDWQACVVDVKTAFLYAPVRGAQEEGEEQPVIVVKPPYLLVRSPPGLSMGLRSRFGEWSLLGLPMDGE